MYEQMFSEARRNETTATDRTLRQRETWHEISRVQRLESALRTARVRLSWPAGNAQAKAS